MLFFDRYYPRDACFSGIEVIQKADVTEKKEAKQKKSKEEKEARYKRP